jgi:hypothetical protein
MVGMLWNLLHERVLVRRIGRGAGKQELCAPTSLVADVNPNNFDVLEEHAVTKSTSCVLANDARVEGLLLGMQRAHKAVKANDEI